jgi:hypothetical protein
VHFPEAGRNPDVMRPPGRRQSLLRLEGLVGDVVLVGVVVGGAVRGEMSGDAYGVYLEGLPALVTDVGDVGHGILLGWF